MDFAMLNDRFFDAPLAVLLIALIYVVLVAVPACRLTRRLGFAGAWGLLALVPGLNVVGLWILAFSRWPRKRHDTHYPELI
jgi:hypothetical protein